MKCPACKSELEIIGQSYLETLIEHVTNSEVSLKDEYGCTNQKCHYNILLNKIFWSEDGEIYGRGFDRNLNNAPYGSLERKLNVETRKLGLPDKWRLPKWFHILGFSPYLEFNYKSNLDGDILDVRLNIGIYIKEEDGGEIVGNFCWQTWSYLWRNFQRHLKNHDLDLAFEHSYNRAWTYVWFEKFVEKVYSQKYKQVKNESNGRNRNHFAF